MKPRVPALAACLASAVVLSGCGSSSPRHHTTTQQIAGSTVVGRSSTSPPDDKQLEVRFQPGIAKAQQEAFLRQTGAEVDGTVSADRELISVPAAKQSQIVAAIRGTRKVLTVEPVLVGIDNPDPPGSETTPPPNPSAPRNVTPTRPASPLTPQAARLAAEGKQAASAAHTALLQLHAGLARYERDGDRRHVLGTIGHLTETLYPLTKIRAPSAGSANFALSLVSQASSALPTPRGTSTQERTRALADVDRQVAYWLNRI